MHLHTARRARCCDTDSCDCHISVWPAQSQRGCRYSTAHMPGTNSAFSTLSDWFAELTLLRSSPVSRWVPTFVGVALAAAFSQSLQTISSLFFGTYDVKIETVSPSYAMYAYVWAERWLRFCDIRISSNLVMIFPPPAPLPQPLLPCCCRCCMAIFSPIISLAVSSWWGWSGMRTSINSNVVHEGNCRPIKQGLVSLPGEL